MAPRPSRPDLRDRKAHAIIEAAATVFAHRGYRVARMADVAAQAGIGKGTVYEYFRSKEDLFLAVFEAYSRGTLEAARRQVQAPPASAEAYLREFAEATLQACQEILYMYPLTMEFWSAAATPEFKDRLMGEFRELYGAYRGVIADVIRRGVESGEFGDHVDADSAAAGLVGALDALFLQAWFDEDFDAVAAGHRFVDVVLRGMASTARAGAARKPGKAGTKR
jgi:AcrR family transcriptional regulator